LLLLLLLGMLESSYMPCFGWLKLVLEVYMDKNDEPIDHSTLLSIFVYIDRCVYNDRSSSSKTNLNFFKFRIL
jgi:hypothetical protein